jgi:hypothetical protein
LVVFGPVGWKAFCVLDKAKPKKTNNRDFPCPS